MNCLRFIIGFLLIPSMLVVLGIYTFIMEKFDIRPDIWTYLGMFTSVAVIMLCLTVFFVYLEWGSK